MNGALAVLGVGVWTPQTPSLETFLLGEEAATPELRPEARLLTARMRGRASLLSAMFANVVEQACSAAQRDPRTVATVFGSAYGEMTTTLALFGMLQSAEGHLSPAKFQASVHNTAAGMLSIAQGNRGFSSSIAAGHDTLAMTLMEAFGWLAARPSQCAVVACADEGAPHALLPAGRFGPLAVAFLLTNEPTPGRVVARLGAPMPIPSPEPSGSEPAAQANPCAPALSLARALFAAQRGRVRLNPCAPSAWFSDVQPRRE